jgi:ABC-type branched-subunit amino acid transport system substrate-binding protein/outer membrane protein assembly factor BamD (BamD/ComL family)
MKKISIIFLFNILLFINGDSILCKNITPSQADKIFASGMAYYNKGEYQIAYKMFSNPELNNADKILRMYSLFMQGQSLYEMKDYVHSVDVLKRYLMNYSSEKFRSECLYLLGNNYYKMGLFDQALRSYLSVLNYGGNSQTLIKSQENALNLFSDALDIKDFENIKEEFDNQDIRNILDIKIANEYVKIGKLKEAENVVTNVLNTTNGKFYFEQAKELSEYINKLKEKSIIIGLILPLEGEKENIGKGIYEGAELAREEFNQTHKRKINFLVSDSKSDPIESVVSIRNFIENNFVIGILGALDKGICAGVCVEANHKKIPIILPLTNDGSFSFLGEYVFQVNADYTFHINRIAEYSLKELGIKTFAILAPISRDGLKVVEGFKKVVDNYNGIIVSEQEYFPGSFNLATQFKNIRNQGFKMMFQDNLPLMDSVDVSTSNERKLKDFEDIFFSMKKMEILKKISGNVSSVDSLDIPITSIDGLFLPVEKDDIKIIVSQFHSYNIKTNVFGLNNWYDPKFLEKNIDYVDNMVFTSDYFIEESNTLFLEFVNKFRVKYSRTPQMPEVYGYDCMKLFLQAIENGALTREDLKIQLSQIENFQGIKGKISFDKNLRTNKYVNLLKYSDGKIIEIQ